MNPEKTIILIDGSSFLYRAYYGLRPLHTAKGEPVQAVYGFCRMIKKLIGTFKPSFMALVWDSKGKTVRHELFHEYKATRQAPPSDLFSQKELIIEFADAIGLYQCAQQGVEADDLLYSLALDWKKTAGSVVIVTSDKDMGQALDHDIVLYDAFKEVIIDKDAFEKKMGFSVEKSAFYFGLVGDTSDNIPGVKGIGEKSALELVNKFESLKDLYKNIDTIDKKRITTALENAKDDAFLSEKLFTLHYYQTDATKEKLAFDENKWSNARSFFEKLQFQSLLKEIKNVDAVEQEVIHSSKKGRRYECVTTEEQLLAVVEEVKKYELFAYDTEGYGQLPVGGTMVGLSICCIEGISYYIPFGHKTDHTQLSQKFVLETLKPLFEDAKYKKIVHHAKFDALVLLQQGIAVSGVIFDTLIAASLVRQEWQKISLKVLSDYYLKEPMLTFAHVVTENKYPDFSYVPLDLATEYAAADSHQTLLLYPLLKKMIHENEMDHLYSTIELPLADVLTSMEERGISCDISVLKKLDVIVSKQLIDIKESIEALVGQNYKDINLNSPKQVEELLFTHLHLPPQKKSAKGTGYSTDYEVLVELAKQHPVPGFIAQYREMFKLKTTYIDALPTFINEKTGSIHTTFSQTQVATGRLSSSEPNLQNIPAEGLGLTVRSAFVPGKGRLFLSADYSQIELRVLAHFSKDKQLVQAFLEGHDIHAQTASGLFGVPIDKISKHQRSIGKRINFSILYGLTPFGLSKDLDISLKDAKTYIEAYFKHYPQVSVWMETIIEYAKKHGYVTTWSGRRRYVPGINERNKHLFELAKRVAVNTVAQGTAAEVMKLGMLAVDKALKKYGNDAFIVLQIHDELLLSVVEEKVEEVTRLVKKELESIVSWEIPLVVVTSSGINWKEVT